jgi:hypothetical protein
MLIGALGPRGKSRYFGGAGMRDFAIGKGHEVSVHKADLLSVPIIEQVLLIIVMLCVFLLLLFFEFILNFYASRGFTNISRTRSLLRNVSFRSLTALSCS